MNNKYIMRKLPNIIYPGLHAQSVLKLFFGIIIQFIQTQKRIIRFEGSISLRVKQVLLPIVLMLLFGTVCYAEGDTLFAGAKAGDEKSDKPTVITADTMELDMVKNMITFEGSVVVVKDENKISADLIYVYLKSEEEKEKSEDKKKKEDTDMFGNTGGGGSQEVDKIIAIGHVVIEKMMPEIDGKPQPRQKAVGGHGVYDTEKGTMVLTKKPMLIYGDGSYINGTKITLWLASDRMKVEGNRSAGRLSKLVLTPQDQAGMDGGDVGE